jgi:hypothetical protein
MDFLTECDWCFNMIQPTDVMDMRHDGVQVHLVVACVCGWGACYHPTQEEWEWVRASLQTNFIDDRVAEFASVLENVMTLEDVNRLWDGAEAAKENVDGS